jgi:hypothetical protein
MMSRYDCFSSVSRSIFSTPGLLEMKIYRFHIMVRLGALTLLPLLSYQPYCFTLPRLENSSILIVIQTITIRGHSGGYVVT